MEFQEILLLGQEVVLELDKTMFTLFKLGFFRYYCCLLLSIYLFAQSCTQPSKNTDSMVNSKGMIEPADSSSRSQEYTEKNIGSTNYSNLYLEDMNADSIIDSIFVIPPKINETGDVNFQDCVGPCISKIVFGDILPDISVTQSVGGDVKVLDDINEDGIKEIAFFPYWFQSCWSRIDIFSYSGNDWKLIKYIDYNSCDETLPTSFEKIEKGMLRVTTNGAQFEEDNSEIESVQDELPGLEVKIYDIEIK
ncbi:MAG: hypothetical protein J5I91_02135 [Bacteroidetes bacterium]|nr:hypothetical protein [Bacteroidota bacterium]